MDDGELGLGRGSLRHVPPDAALHLLIALPVVLLLLEQKEKTARKGKEEEKGDGGAEAQGTERAGTKA